MRFYVLVTLALITSLFVAGCQKDIEPFPQTNPPVTDSSGTDSTENPPVTDTNALGSYHPLSTGSTWTYKDSASGAR